MCSCYRHTREAHGLVQIGLVVRFVLSERFGGLECLPHLKEVPAQRRNRVRLTFVYGISCISASRSDQVQYPVILT